MIKLLNGLEDFVAVDQHFYADGVNLCDSSNIFLNFNLRGDVNVFSSKEQVWITAWSIPVMQHILINLLATKHSTSKCNFRNACNMATGQRLTRVPHYCVLVSMFDYSSLSLLYTNAAKQTTVMDPSYKSSVFDSYPCLR